MRIISKTYLQSFLLLLGIFFLNIAQAQYDIPPKPSDEDQKFVYDYAKLLPKGDNAFLEQKLNKYADSTSTQMVIVIIESLKGESIGMLTPKWGHKWGIGQEGKDNGVIILLAKQERKIWISPGYGAENKLTAGITGQIVRNRIIPYFKRGDYPGGLNSGIDSIIEVLNGEFKNDRKSSKGKAIHAGVVFLLIFIFIVLISILANNKRNGGGGNHRGGRRDTTGSDLFDIIILSNMGRGGFGSGRSSGGGSSSGGFGGGGFGGGFSGGGGFGGGGFSGGGAGGSW